MWHGPHYTVPLRAQVPKVVTVHDLTLLEHPEWHERPKALYFGRMIPAAVARAAVCVCVSRHTAERLDALVPRRRVGSRDVVVVPHGVDHVRFRPEPDRRARPRSPRPARGAPAVRCVPRHHRAAQGHARRSCRPFARVAATQPDLTLVVAGGQRLGRLATPTRRSEASGMASRVVRDRVRRRRRRARAHAPASRSFVYPALEEGFGLPALEALGVRRTRS